MLRDKNGRELKIGDEVMIRAHIEEIHSTGDDENAAILKVKWDSAAVPFLDYLKPGAVEKCLELDSE
jgi:hypothetical protein